MNTLQYNVISNKTNYSLKYYYGAKVPSFYQSLNIISVTTLSFLKGHWIAFNFTDSHDIVATQYMSGWTSHLSTFSLLQCHSTVMAIFTCGQWRHRFRRFSMYDFEPPVRWGCCFWQLDAETSCCWS